MLQTDKIKVLLADDHVMMREGLANLVNAQPDMEVVDEASDGKMAVEKARNINPNVVVYGYFDAPAFGSGRHGGDPALLPAGARRCFEYARGSELSS